MCTCALCRPNRDVLYLPQLFPTLCYSCLNICSVFLLFICMCVGSMCVRADTLRASDLSGTGVVGNRDPLRLDAGS